METQTNTESGARVLPKAMTPIKKYEPVAPVPAPSPAVPGNHACGSVEKRIILMAMKAWIFLLACVVIRRPALIWKTYKSRIRLRSEVWGDEIRKLYRVAGKYYITMYTPGWPSRAYTSIWKSELRRQVPGNTHPEKTFFAFFAITRKCPMRCEHCFEWDNLNQKESFSKDDLIRVLNMYQKSGIQQFHFSGGEPMVRIKDLLELVRQGKGKSDCWVVTSGFNCTPENARLLKEAGCKGVVVSIDHYIPEFHNIFRGHPDAFRNATHAVHAIKEAGMVSAISVCVTKTFIDGGHLMPYVEFARSLGVQFVQLLEPRNIGHYAGKNVSLEEKHIRTLENFYKKINLSGKYRRYPTLLYHGYHQRRIGCFAGSRSIYIDSAGDVHSCPFCHTSSYNIIQLIRDGKNDIPQKENACPQFNKIA
jgi:MoaA/NifB/PqqE/SkfB family radical SAM enzyme